jgi:AmiR/NasT family two-component response regulator
VQPVALGDDDLAERITAALEGRVVVEQAKGVLAQIHGGTPDDGFALMRRYSRDHRIHLSDVARAVVSDPTSVPGLTAPRR